MKSIHLVILFIFITVNFMYAQKTFYSKPFAHTYSIVARDTKTGEMGVAVQSHWFSVGSIVAWGEAGVGVIATQSFVNVSFGPRGLALLKRDKTAPQVVEALINYSLYTARLARKKGQPISSAWNNVEKVFQKELMKCTNDNF